MWDKNSRMLMKDIEADHIVSQDFNLGEPTILTYAIRTYYFATELEAFKAFWKLYRQLKIPRGYLCWRTYPQWEQDEKNLFRLKCRFSILPIKSKPINIEDFFNNDWLQDALLTETPYGGYHGR